MTDRELNAYLAADNWTDVGHAVRDGLLADLTSDRISARTVYLQSLIPEDREVSFTLTAKDMHPEALALMTGMHPAHFDTEGRALVQGILDGNPRIPMKPATEATDGGV